MTDKNGKQINQGDQVQNFRGESATFLRITRGTECNGTARVEVEYPDGWKQDLYAQVFDLKVQTISDWVAEQDRNVITDANVDEIMDLADIGADYWTISSIHAANVGDHTPEWASYTVVEKETGLVFHLSRDDIRFAYLVLADPGQTLIQPRTHRPIHSTWTGRSGDGIETADLDSASGDVIQQIACFGKLLH
ncbi:hypothetical protein [Umezawaea sp. Da 62-37]|uniref:hypothetical protein n=1 Tax=Umezawaea sp. Da 62-37 TaxID=3075927 RepID=UPI0028F6D817|nr:hypothetical protein [Umezawaea sp. Da 62-37]WNV90286.1 hypothetical protein RM788_18980 [Umezawaea sp. Da 62-37]